MKATPQFQIRPKSNFSQILTSLMEMLKVDSCNAPRKKKQLFSLSLHSNETHETQQISSSRLDRHVIVITKEFVGLFFFPPMFRLNQHKLHDKFLLSIQSPTFDILYSIESTFSANTKLVRKPVNALGKCHLWFCSTSIPLIMCGNECTTNFRIWKHLSNRKLPSKITSRLIAIGEVKYGAVFIAPVSMWTRIL